MSTRQVMPLRRSARLMGSSATLAPPAPEVKKVKAKIDRASKKANATTAESKKNPGNGDKVFKHGTLSRDIEQRIYDQGFTRVVGVDEAGRGPLAGPVVAAACFIPLDVTIEGIYDSKQLNEAQREALFEQLTTHKDIQYAVHVSKSALSSVLMMCTKVNSPQRIDEINILQVSTCHEVNQYNSGRPPWSLCAKLSMALVLRLTTL
ncbi:hypothetical protein AC1031_018184 [Aphanomyces cochlioides]|nr:hypothetical protein AC1031_018184 [Aphanomyces cochlioides]